MTVDNNSIDHNKFQSFHDLLFQKKWSVQQLATAMETAGCYGWDRFGRFQLSNPSDEDERAVIAKQALDALASYREFEVSKQAQYAPEEDEVLRVYKNKLEQLKLFGWMEKDLPTIGKPTYDPPQPSIGPNDSDMFLSTAYRIIIAIAVQTEKYDPMTGKFKHGWFNELAEISSQLELAKEDGELNGVHRTTFSKHLNKAVEYISQTKSDI